MTLYSQCLFIYLDLSTLAGRVRAWCFFWFAFGLVFWFVSGHRLEQPQSNSTPLLQSRRRTADLRGFLCNGLDDNKSHAFGLYANLFTDAAHKFFVVVACAGVRHQQRLFLNV